ncbi:hypothetical protein HYX08_06225 [Candidatus Woesearchaeota archaeon]|nr:hypothetical protein [Candidatus Woesearchaeota archaeon]
MLGGLLRSTNEVKGRINSLVHSVHGKVLDAAQLRELALQHKPDYTSKKSDETLIEPHALNDPDLPLERRIPESFDRVVTITMYWKPLFRNEQARISFRFVPGIGYTHTYLVH